LTASIPSQIARHFPSATVPLPKRAADARNRHLIVKQAAY
jgi:hypothetical protein